MNIHEHMAERMQIAGIYAQDGAFRTAASVLQKLAADLREHAENCELAIGGMTRKESE